MCARILLLSAFLFNLCTGVCSGYEVSISSREIKQGGTLIVRVKEARSGAGYACYFGGTVYPVYPGGEGHLRVIIGIEPTFATGSCKLKVAELYGKDHDSDKAFFINVIPGGFKKEVLKFSPEKKSLLYLREVKKEKKLIGKALGTEDKRQHWNGNFLLPVEGRITGRFGSLRYDEKGKLLWYHKGIDIGTPTGTEVKAANSGVVLLARDNFMLHGKTVFIYHGQGISSIYLHLSRINVEEGQKVKKGDIIAYSGATGLSTGPHLHWGLYVHGKAVDPLFWVSNAP